MTRESKLALIIGITLILLVGVLLSDHLSGATEARFDTTAEPGAEDRPVTPLPGAGDAIDVLAGPAQPVWSGGVFPTLGPGAPGLTGDTLGSDGAPVVISQGVASEVALARGDGRGVLDQTLDRLNHSAESAIDRFVMAEPPTLIASKLFVPVEPGAVTVPPRDRRHSATVDAGEAVVHTVVEGDNLYRIALKYLGDGDRWPELQRLNADVLGSGSALQIGMRVKVGRATAPFAAQSAEPERPARRYVVLKGDMLSEISQKLLGTTRRMHEIVELNALKDPDDIRVGQTLKIPAR